MNSRVSIGFGGKNKKMRIENIKYFGATDIWGVPKLKSVFKESVIMSNISLLILRSTCECENPLNNNICKPIKIELKSSFSCFFWQLKWSFVLKDAWQWK